MRTDEQIERLQGLLARVQKNAALPRVHAAAPPPVEAQPIPVLTSSIAEETTLVRAIEEPAEIDDVVVEITEPVEELELLEDEIIDITDVGAQSTTEVLVEEEEPPASSRRPIAASMTEALAGAADHVEMDEGREIPLKTPPPESGPQAAPPPVPGAPAVPQIAEVEAVSRSQPTAAHLGATIELEPAPPAKLELGEPVRTPPPHVVREEVPAALAATPPAPPAEVRPQVVERPKVASAPAGAFVTAARSFQPETFAELLDASLSLG